MVDVTVDKSVPEGVHTPFQATQEALFCVKHFQYNQTATSNSRLIFVT